MHRAFRGEVLIVDGAGRSHHLTGAAAVVWIGLDEPGSMAEVRDRLVGVGLGPEAVGAETLDDGLALLAASGLVGPEPGRVGP